MNATHDLEHLTEDPPIQDPELALAYERLMSESDPTRLVEAKKNLIRAIFGPNAIAEDSVS